jgi:hypothetical protein
MTSLQATHKKLSKQLSSSVIYGHTWHGYTRVTCKWWDNLFLGRLKEKVIYFTNFICSMPFLYLWMVNITDVCTANTWDHMISNGKQRKFVNKSMKTSDHRFTITLISIWWPAMNEHTYANNFFHFSRIMRAFTICRRMSVLPSARSLPSLQRSPYNILLASSPLQHFIWLHSTIHLEKEPWMSISILFLISLTCYKWGVEYSDGWREWMPGAVHIGMMLL